jgi:hypothetical protein
MGELPVAEPTTSIREAAETIVRHLIRIASQQQQTQRTWGKKAESRKQKAEIQADGLMGQTSGAGNTRSKSPATSEAKS